VSQPDGVGGPAHTDGASRSYGRVLLVWVLVLAGLYLFQEYFS
jgi:hypothetical protein